MTETWIKALSQTLEAIPDAPPPAPAAKPAKSNLPRYWIDLFVTPVTMEDVQIHMQGRDMVRMVQMDMPTSPQKAAQLLVDNGADHMLRLKVVGGSPKMKAPYIFVRSR